MKNLLRPVFYIALAIVTVWTYVVPDAQGFQYPGMARVFFWHFPCSMLLLGFMFAGVYFSLRVFWRIEGLQLTRVETAFERSRWDSRADSAMELGFIWACLTMLTGILFSLVQWGAAWQWDPRQTSFLIALLIYSGYFALRNSFVDLDKRAHFAGAYALASAWPILFLEIVFPRLPAIQAESFHPTNTIMQGQLHGQYGYVTIAMLALMTTLSIWLYKMRTGVALLEISLDNKHSDGNMEILGRRAAPTSVVRPLDLSRENRSPNEGP